MEGMLRVLQFFITLSLESVLVHTMTAFCSFQSSDSSSFFISLALSLLTVGMRSLNWEWSIPRSQEWGSCPIPKIANRRFVNHRVSLRRGPMTATDSSLSNWEEELETVFVPEDLKYPPGAFQPNAQINVYWFQLHTLFWDNRTFTDKRAFSFNL